MLDEKLRKPAIGGSEIAALFGVHDYLDEFTLWARKKGQLPPEESSPRMRLGKHLEQGIVAYYAEIEKVEVEWCDRTSRHPVHQFMVYTPDALVVGKDRGVDSKLVGWDQKHRWGRDVDHIPDHAVMQAWWYMAALDYSSWDIAALVMGEDQPRVYRVERRIQPERLMLGKARNWWERYLIGDERPPISGSETARVWLRNKFPRPARPDIDWATASEEQALEEYSRLRAAWDTLTEQKDKLECQLREMVGDRAGIKWPGGQFTWKLAADSEKIVWKDLAQALLEQHPAGQQLVQEFTYKQAGVRRINFTRNGDKNG